MNVNALHPRPERLPEKTEEFAALRALKTHRTLNDQVEEIAIVLWTDERFRRLLDAVWDEDAVEGSLAADNIVAAQMIRERGKKIESEIGHKKLATIAKALGIVLRRYESSRRERRNRVHGEQVRQENNAE
jgi:hypothetical protein